MLFFDTTIDYPDGTRIRCSLNQYNKRTRLVFVHGLSSSLEMYRYMFAYCDAQDIALNCMELRGHGNSDGSMEERGYFEKAVTDLKRFIFGHIQNEPVYIAAEGPGAFLLPYLVSDQRFHITGGVLISPVFRLSLSVPEKVLVGGMSVLLPSWPVSIRQSSINAFCDDPESTSLFESSCVYSPLFIRSILKQQKYFVQSLCEFDDIPFLIISGETDPLIDWKNHDAVLRRITEKNKRARYILMKNECHHLLLGKLKLDVLAKIIQWIQQTEKEQQRHV